MGFAVNSMVPNGKKLLQYFALTKKKWNGSEGAISFVITPDWNSSDTMMLFKSARGKNGRENMRLEGVEWNLNQTSRLNNHP
jgi:hypothetical protein